MKTSAMKQNLTGLKSVNFRLPDGSYLLSHFHVTPIGLITRHFIDCGDVEQNSIVKFGLDFDKKDFVLTPKGGCC
jgi:hypothetical protein